MRTFREYCAKAESFGCDRDVYAEYKDWLVTPFARHRDSECWQESNFHVALKRLEATQADDFETVHVLRFRHWAVGWVEHILIKPGTPAETLARELVAKLEDYSLLDEDDHSEREQAAADLTWRNCYRPAERIRYIREHRKQFDFRDFADLLGCVRGKYFAGYASEMAGP